MSEERKQCPDCGEWFKNVKAHQALKHPPAEDQGTPGGEDGAVIQEPGNLDEAVTSMWGQLQERVDATISDRMTRLTEHINEMIGQIDGRIQEAAQQSARQVAQEVLGQLPTLIDARVQSGLDQLTAALNEQLGGLRQPGPTGGSPAGAPTGNSTLDKFITAVQAAKSAGLIQDEQANPMAQMQVFAQMASVIDAIRGNPGSNQGNLNPKTALDWAKWGHEMAKAGMPPPDFATGTVQKPPGDSA